MLTSQAVSLWSTLLDPSIVGAYGGAEISGSRRKALTAAERGLSVLVTVDAIFLFRRAA